LLARVLNSVSQEINGMNPPIMIGGAMSARRDLRPNADHSN
jgi:hypothetical protein